MDVITAYATKNPCYKAGKKLTPKGIVVHSTGAENPNLKRYVDAPAEVGTNPNKNYFNRSDAKTCVHAFIGYDKSQKILVAQILPYNIACWGCGSGKNGSYNASHIQFEICEDDKKSSTYFAAIYKEAVEYCAYLCMQYKLDPMKKGVIVGHCEAHALGYASNHADPMHWFKLHNKTMDDFRKDVKAAMGKTPSAKVSSDTKNKPAATLYPTLRKGSRGTDVKKMQAKLNAKGFCAGANDGIFGAKTLAAVKAFQKANKLTVDGIAGQKTLSKLYS